MTSTVEWFLGVDWGEQTHAWCLLDAHGVVVGTRSVAHTAEALGAALAWVETHTGPRLDTIGVAIETPRGVLVQAFVERGYQVFAINPKQLDRFRDRFTAAGAKDDSRDAQVLADGLRTDRRAFHAVCPDPATLIVLREWVRIVEDLQEEEQRLSNRLRDQLYRVDAPWLTLSPAANEPWLWTVLGTAPDPATWATLPRRRVAAALRAHRIRRVTADEVLQALRRPCLHPAAGVTDAVAARVATLVPQLALVHQQRVEAERQIDQQLAQLATAPLDEPREHRDVEILLSLPGVGRIVAATMLTEAVDPLGTRDYDRLRAYTGVAPVTKRSGKRLLMVHMRRACNPRLRQALYHWARNSIQHDSAARHYYTQLRQRGHGHPRALRSVADRWLRILIAMLRAGTLYDPLHPDRRLPAAA